MDIGTLSQVRKKIDTLVFLASQNENFQFSELKLQTDASRKSKRGLPN
jgi:hypothetical protein